MREITKRIRGCENKSHKEVAEKLKRNDVKYDGLLISVDTGIAYLWGNVTNKRIAPVRS